jgi:hypothetical protein
MFVDQFKTETDVLIIGAGASGMTAAISAHDHGADVILVEKYATVGGTAAISGGIVWAPKNPHMDKAGIEDSHQAAKSYFQSLGHGDIDEDVLDAFIENAGAAIQFLEDKTPVAFAMLPSYPDYYLDRPGALAGGGRALDNDLFSYKTLGDWADKVFAAGPAMPVMLREIPLGGGDGQIAPEVFQKRIENDERGTGAALVGGLLKGCLDRDIKPITECDVLSLERNDNRIVGAKVVYNGEEKTIATRRAVLVCTGGFEWNEELKTSFLRGPLTHPASPPTNQGDGLKLAMSVGVGLGNMTSAWWTPVIAPPGDSWPDGSPRAHPVLFERTLPHSIMVNSAGQRFCNEATNYSALAGAFHYFDPNKYGYPNLPAWIIFDHTYKSNYAVASAPPGPDTPAWIKRADTLQDLAQEISAPPDALTDTVRRFNKNVAAGSDPDFGRGKSEYDVFYGDRSRDGVSGTLGALATPPFYAVELNIGALGTNGGIKSDARARALDVHGNVISGLYAAGNVMASATGSVYAGAGGTLGPALTFGYIAGRDAALLRNQD